MRQFCKLLRTFLLLGYIPAALSAQQQGMEWLTTKHGLSQGFVSCMLQDREGFIWVGTKNGLNRYDGYRFEVFTHDPFDEYSLSSDFVSAIAEHGDFLVISTKNTGINLFHKKTRQVYRLTNDLLVTDAPVESMDAFMVFVDAAGNIWTTLYVPNRSNSLFKITLPSGFWQDPAAFPNFRKQLKLQTWPEGIQYGPIISSDLKTIYALTNTHTIVQIEPQSGNWTKLIDITAPLGYYGQINIGPTGELWYAQGIGTGQTKLYRYLPGDPKGLMPVTTPAGFENILCVSNDYIWVDQFNTLSVFRLNQYKQFDHNSPEIPPISISPGQYCGMVDQSGLSWIGTNGMGLIKINVRSKRFHHLFPGKSVYGNVFLDQQGNILTTDNNPGYLFSFAQHNSAKPPFWNAVQALHPEPRILQDGAGVYWIVGVYPSSRKVILQKIEPGGRTRVFSAPVNINYYNQFAVSFDNQGHLWMGMDEHLIHFNPSTEHFDVFEYSQKLKDAKGVMAMAMTADGSWWIGRDNGLVQAKPAAQGFDFNVFKNDPKNRNSLRSNNIASLLADPSDQSILWIGTKGGGLNRLDTRTMHFTHLTSTEGGLPDNVIYSVLPDDRKRLWMSSNKGLICYTPATGAIKNYTKEDGLQDNEFNTWAYGKGPDGTLLFGGINGLTVFHPNQLLEDTLPPKTHITGLLVNDRAVFWKESPGILKQTIEFAPEITVPFSMNNLNLEFVALNFTSPEKNRFRYYLEGAESEWEHESSSHTAAYLNLAPGTYTFHVKGSNSEGVWSTQPAALKITVLPPWYRTWLAWIAYILIVVGGAYAFYRYQLRTKLEHAENRRLKELDAFKSRFFTNITHELRTPLTVILGMTARLEKNEKDKEGRATALQLIRRNGQNLLRLINEILDLAKLESNALKMDYVQGDVLSYLRYISESLHSLANAKNVLLRVESDQPKIVMDYDPERLLQIVHNLLSNAIKFTPGGGRVQLSATIDNGSGSRPVPSGTSSAQFLLFTVTDTGMGIPPEDLPHIFERFFQAKNQEQASSALGGGTGIGLSLTRELVRAMGGEITAESTLGKGSTFRVKLPITYKAASAEHKLDSINELYSVEPNGLPNPGMRSAGAESLQLLIIEDNADVVEYLSDCVGAHYQLSFAYNGRAGIEKATETIPDIIVSDVMMPEKDGFEVCDTLKNDPRTSHIPIVLLTARATIEDRIAGLRRGADAYLAKPFDQEELLVTLENLTRLRARLQARYSGGVAPSPTEDKGLQIEDAFLQKMHAVVEAHLSDSDFEMPHLQRKMAMSHSQIFRKLKALTGKSPSQFIRDIRLAKAKELLASSELTVSEIAYETGFSSLQYFSDSFFEAYGKRPSAMRK